MLDDGEIMNNSGDDQSSIFTLLLGKLNLNGEETEYQALYERLSVGANLTYGNM